MEELVPDDGDLLLVAGGEAALVVQGLLEGDDLGDVTDVRDHQADLVVLVIDGGAGDQDPFAGFEGLVHGDGLVLGEGLEGGGVGDDPPADQLIHGHPQNILGGEAGDDLVGVVAPDGAGLVVGDEDAVEGALQNGQHAGQGGGLVGGEGDGDGIKVEIDAVSFHGGSPRGIRYCRQLEYQMNGGKTVVKLHKNAKKRKKFGKGCTKTSPSRGCFRGG